jgi:hypothetical protein
MILSATFDPEVLHTLATLFEEVWVALLLWARLYDR